MKHTTLLYIYLFNTHTYYISNLHLTYLYIHNCLFCILCLCYICILLFLLSVSCPVAVNLSHCGASVTKTNSSYVQTCLAIKLILILLLKMKAHKTVMRILLRVHLKKSSIHDAVLHCLSRSERDQSRSEFTLEMSCVTRL